MTLSDSNWDQANKSEFKWDQELKSQIICFCKANDFLSPSEDKEVPARPNEAKSDQADPRNP